MEGGRKGGAGRGEIPTFGSGQQPYCPLGITQQVVLSGQELFPSGHCTIRSSECKVAAWVKVIAGVKVRSSADTSRDGVLYNQGTEKLNSVIV